MGCELTGNNAGRQAGEGTSDSPVLHVRSLSKSFPGQVALDDAELVVRRGQVHALLGQNGSGKSTLIKVLAGFHRPDQGADVELGGRDISPDDLAGNHDDRIRVMHQDLGLVESMNVMENLALGRGFHSNSIGRISWTQERRRAVELLGSFGLRVDPTTRISRLSAAEQAIVGLARAMQDWDERGGLLVLDEPTASLPRPEVLRLFDAVRRVAARGAGILLVTHRLDEVFDIADWVTVLRDGRTVGSRSTVDLDERILVEMIIGRPASELYAEPPEISEDTVYEARRLWGHTVENFSLTVRAGEIVGIAGIVGSGREEIASLLSGVSLPAAGTIHLGQDPLPRDVRAARRAGMAFVPADRPRLGSIQNQTVAANILLGSVGSLYSKAWLSTRRELAEADTWIDSVGLRPADPSRVLSTLSGGNQQKAILARVLRQGPRVIVLDEPTQGVDVGAKATVYELLAAAARDGAAVIVSSSDIDELSNICDRVLVMRGGRIAADLRSGQMTTESIAEQCLR